MKSLIKDKRSLTSVANGKLGGRPVAQHTLDVIEARKYIIAETIKHIEPLMKVLVNKALDGDMIAFKELFDRGFGKTAQALEVTGKDGNPIVFMPLELINKHNLSAEKPKELATDDYKLLDK